MQKKFYFVFKWFWKYKIFSIIIFLFQYWLNNKISCLTFFLSRKSPVIRFSCPNIVIHVLILHVLPLSCHFLFCSILVLLSFSPMFDLSYFFLLSNAFLFNVCHSDGCHPLRLHFLNILKGVFANNETIYECIELHSTIVGCIISEFFTIWVEKSNYVIREHSL